MKRPDITPGPWAPIFDNPLSILQGHTIKAQDEARTPVAEAFKGRGASLKGAAEQKANARAIAALPDLLEALEQARSLIAVCRARFPKSVKNPDTFKLCLADAAINKALTKAGYTF